MVIYQRIDDGYDSLLMWRSQRKQPIRGAMGTNRISEPDCDNLLRMPKNFCCARATDSAENIRLGITAEIIPMKETTRRRPVESGLRKSGIGKQQQETAVSPINGIDHNATSGPQRDRSVAGMSASFKRMAESRMSKLLTEFTRMRALADRARYRWDDAHIDKMEEALFVELQETIGAFRTGSGTKKRFSFD